MRKFAYILITLILTAGVASGDLPLPQVPYELRTPAERADYVGLHFWDAMDFSDKAALNEAEMAQNVANYLSVFPIMSDDSARSAAAGILWTAAAVSDDAASLISNTLEDYLFTKASPMRDERLFTLFLREKLKAGYADSLRTRWMLEMTSKNLPGMPATDFSFYDRDGRRHKLSDYFGKPILLFFHDPDCDICHAAAADLSRDFVLANRISQGRAQIIAIYPGDLASWQSTISTFPSLWLDGCANNSLDGFTPNTPANNFPEWHTSDDSANDNCVVVSSDKSITDNNLQSTGSETYPDLYIIPEFPAFYLIAPDGSILLKDAPLSLIISTLLNL